MDFGTETAGARFAARAPAARELAEGVRAGRLSPRAIVEDCLARIDAVDDAVRAFVALDRDEACAIADARAAEAAAGRFRGPLHGVPFAVKDVIDVAGHPTRAGSRARADSAPARQDATMVARLKAAGAIVLGKAHTTEFAYFADVPPTRNPHDLARTPGGSSGGSAAAVAAGMVPFALGTQTAGSVNRPAAFCGIGAFKPTTLSMGGSGLVHFAPSLDTIGVLAGTAADAAFALMAFAPDGVALAPGDDPAAAEAVFLADPLLEECAEPAAKAALASLGERLAASGMPVRTAPSPVPLAEVVAAHRVVMLHELGRTRAELLSVPERVGAVLLEAIREGSAIPEAAYLDALATLAALRARVWAAFSPPALLVLPAAPGPAPVGEATGDPTFAIVATALSGPTATIPAGRCADTGMPLGALLTRAPGTDAALARLLLAAGPGSPLSD